MYSNIYNKHKPKGLKTDQFQNWYGMNEGIYYNIWMWWKYDIKFVSYLISLQEQQQKHPLSVYT